MTCGELIPSDEDEGYYPCVRVKGHDGECDNSVFGARKLDGLHLCCGTPKTAPHREICRRWS